MSLSIFSVMPDSQKIAPERSESVITVAPSCISFCAAKLATLPEPEITHFLPSNVSPRIASMFCAK